MNRQGYLFWVLIGLIVALGIETGCTPAPVKVTKPAAEPSVASPLALPTVSEPLDDTSPLAQPTVGQDLSPTLMPPGKTGVSIPAQATKAVAWAQADLAARLNVATDQVTIVSVEFVQWPDSSLGCPQSSKMYAQVITPGYRILLQSRDKPYEYHSAQGRNTAILCPGNVEVTPRQPPVDVELVPIPSVAMARADLARRLTVDAALIETVQVTSQRSDAPDMPCLTKGSVPESLLVNLDQAQWISLSFKDNVYHYIALADLVVYCGQ